MNVSTKTISLAVFTRFLLLISLGLYVVLWLTPMTQAAWSCVPDYSLATPYETCVSFQDDNEGVIGSGDPDLEFDETITNAQATIKSYEQVLSSASVWQGISSADKRRFLYKLSALFEVLFKDATI